MRNLYQYLRHFNLAQLLMLVQSDRGSVAFPAGRTSLCLLFALRNMQIRPELQV